MRCAGPVLYGFIWFSVFGGAGLRMERQAANLGIDCVAGPDDMGDSYFLVRRSSVLDS